MQDHKIDGFITFPGAAYLCMVLEALDQTLSDKRPTKSSLHYIFRNVSFLKALVLPETCDKVEIQLKIEESRHDAHRNSSGLWDFQIASLPPNGAWSKNCRGSVIMGLESAIDRVEMFDEDELQADADRESLQRIEALSTHEIYPKLYAELRSKGNDYGESFALLSHVKVGDLNAIGRWRCLI